MRIVFICQAVDQDDPILGFAVRWIEVLANKPNVEKVDVLALRSKEYKLPKNVAVHSIGGGKRFVTLTRFYRRVFALAFRGVDCFFIHMGGPYPALLLPLKLLGKPVYQWKTHPYVSGMMHFYARFCDTKLFTATRNSFPVDLPNLKIVGHGIDTEQFCIKPVERLKGLVTVGRIAPVKRLDLMISSLALCKRVHGVIYPLDIYGPTSQQDEEYRQYLERLIKELKLSDSISFMGTVRHDQLPAIFNQYRLFLSFSQTALDKATLEAMACGVPVLSTNSCVEEILPAEIASTLIAPENDPRKQADQVHRMLSLDAASLREIGKSLREVVVRNHSVVSLFGRILAEMGAENEKNCSS